MGKICVTLSLVSGYGLLAFLVFTPVGYHLPDSLGFLIAALTMCLIFSAGGLFIWSDEVSAYLKSKNGRGFTILKILVFPLRLFGFTLGAYGASQSGSGGPKSSGSKSATTGVPNQSTKSQLQQHEKALVKPGSGVSQSESMSPPERGKTRWLVEMRNSSGTFQGLHVWGDSESHAMKNAENRDSSWTATSAKRVK